MAYFKKRRYARGMQFAVFSPDIPALRDSTGSLKTGPIAKGGTLTGNTQKEIIEHTRAASSLLPQCLKTEDKAKMLQEEKP
jgi:hypothetical protein